jgi:hypothetical protein
MALMDEHRATGALGGDVDSDVVALATTIGEELAGGTLSEREKAELLTTLAIVQFYTAKAAGDLPDDATVVGFVGGVLSDVFERAGVESD